MIYYFSGTGNSKWVARMLASILGERLVEIGDAIRSGKFRYELASDESIGWVFPVYSWGPPPVALDFISKWHVNGYKKDKTYCYMVAVCGDDIGLTADIWRKALGYIYGNAAFSVQMPNNYILLPGFDVDSKDVEREKLERAKSRVEEVAKAILAKSHVTDVVTGSCKWIKSRVIRPFFNAFLMSDRRFKVDADVCTSCGLCAKVCPMKNITMDEKGLPRWNGNCAMCLGCIHHCPVRAIQYGDITRKRGRYFLKAEAAD